MNLHVPFLLFASSFLVVSAEIGSEVGGNGTAIEVRDFDVSRFVQQLLLTSDMVLSTGQRLSIRIDELENFVPSEDIQEGFPYYMAGYDDENRPIWVIEFGKWDLRSVIEQGQKKVDQFDMHVYAGIYRLYKSIIASTAPDGGAVSDFSIIIDFEGLKFRQIAHVSTAAHLITLFRIFNELLVRHLHLAMLINMNYIAERMLNMVRPVLGSAAEKMVIFGSNREKWLPALLRAFPRDQMPEWYGGTKNFLPLQVHG